MNLITKLIKTIRQLIKFEFFGIFLKKNGKILEINTKNNKNVLLISWFFSITQKN